MTLKHATPDASTAEPKSSPSSMTPISRGDKAVLYAYRKGYRVSPEGKVLNPDGIALKLSFHGKNSARYPYFRLRNPYRKPSHIRINAGRLAAYCYWKGRIFQPGVVVARCISGPSTDLSRDNLALVTRSQRQRHRSRTLRRAQASRAASLKPAHTRGRALSDEDVRLVRYLWGLGTPKSQLARHYGVSETVIKLICFRRTYRDVPDTPPDPQTKENPNER